MPAPTFLRRWQFSSRELLMLTVNVALLLTVWRLVDSGSLATTTFFDTFDLSAEMEFAQELGRPTLNGGGWGRWNHGIRKFRYSFKLPGGGSPQSVLAVVEELVVQRLQDAGCTLASGVPTANALHGFSLE